MLWSYFKFFQPDRNNKYNFNGEHDSNSLLSFDDWVLEGRVGIGRTWADFVPDFVTDKNLTPLSLEAHVCNSSAEVVVERIFKLESQTELVEWLSKSLETDVSIKQYNSSFESDTPRIGADAREMVRLMFPMESMMYDLYL